MHTSPGLQFTLNRAPITSEEQRIVARHLHKCGLDEGYWAAMNGLLTTKSRSDTPLALRAHRGERLVGIAHLLECRRTNQCLFPGIVGRVLDLVPTPTYYWTRADPAVDLLGSPGFLAEGEDEQAFYRKAVRFLNSRYLMGVVMEERGKDAADSCYETVFMDWGRYTVRPDGVEALLNSHKNLRRKENRFRNKGGTLEIVSGALRRDERDAVLHCLRQSAELALARAPFQDNYANMVQWAAESGSPGIVHVLARIEGQVVGYHTFLHSGARLQCLSGGFDRTRHSTFHAYENILLAAMRYAESSGVRHVAFGPVGNPSKAAVMPEFGRFVIRFYSRIAAVRRTMAMLVPRSGMRPEVFASCSGLAASPMEETATDPEPRSPRNVPEDGDSRVAHV